VRRDPDIKWRRRETDLPDLAGRQRALMERAAAVVKAGGRLVYATCSSEPEENEQVVDDFLTAHSEFVPVHLGSELGASLAALVDQRGFLRTSPVHRLEGFFAAAVERRG